MDIDWKVRYEKLYGTAVDLREDLALATAKLSKDPVAIGQAREAKIDRQRRALHILNRRGRVQRLQLRKLNELERGLRPEEWTALKEEFAGELAEEDFDAFK